MAFSLPDSHARIRVRGEVRWRHDTEGAEGGTVTALGVAFRAFEGSDRVTLVRYLLESALHVAVAYANEAQARTIRTALEGHARLGFAQSPAEVHALLSRGDVAVLIVAGVDEVQALSLVEQLASRRMEEVDATGAAPPSDMAARIVFCAPSAPQRLIGLFNLGSIYRTLGPAPEVEEVRRAVLDAGREHGVRTEQRRMALELERNLLRERALMTGGLDAPSPAAGEGPGFCQRGDAAGAGAGAGGGAAPGGGAAAGRDGHRQGGAGAQPSTGMSARGDGRFVVQDCGALTETLLESELFGHVKGAFTGAVADHPGLFVLADGGTIFLDEIENTTPNLQAKLLRVLEDGRRAAGGRHAACATWTCAWWRRATAIWRRRCAPGASGADLTTGSTASRIEVPPLRERPEDVALAGARTSSSCSTGR